ncbi:UDPglucose 6-dehydrogenase [Amycolatopsis xylanica]|uniref:UDP-glucose 6-dehydrogenase n=1 Tax=Amycolatopsis xylanica TaxID=589385 RepID=A0A1H3S9Z7_9PSEU|nr:UDP-glucose/GDP-mannose dehydrogenase family protein [Amycolatopsis xylanica]SDZ34886.1 UDPglucose 6-dehydrogenase [Amycolatopsis xylanica]
MAELAVIGAGYVGLTSAACLARLGNSVVCVDNDPSKVDYLLAGEVGIAEPGLPELVREGLSSGKLTFTTSLDPLRGIGMVMLCLPTPMAADGHADLSVLESVLGSLGDLLGRDGVVVLKSTVPVGTAERAAELLCRADVQVVGNPEFLREGFAVEDFLHPDRIVVGAADQEAGDRVAALYASTGAPVLRTDPASAELAKYASNAFLAMKVSYVNVLAELCERLGAEVAEVAAVMGLDDRIGPAFLSPGPGWGGSCLPKDTSALLRTAEHAGIDFAMLRDAVRANARQQAVIVRKIRCAVTGSASGSLAGARIGLLGLTFKAGTGDLRHSPALAIADELARAGAVLTGYDPGVTGRDKVGPVTVAGDPTLVAKEADAIVVLTEWPEFRDLDWAQLAAVAARPVLVDTRNLLDARALAGTPFLRTGVGTGKPGEPHPR